ncbi:MAG: hypothetical protein A2277_13100 [Desulfobacterales bacterium RIFOXYA12_FULL_46_15]|nr:MAG: hypothetical protein A2277_13100 [Desulfobacterales bacterium RIFOXYA12_FULL_46_15]
MNPLPRDKMIYFSQYTGLLMIWAIVFNLSFQGLALSLHLLCSHHHSHNHETGFFVTFHRPEPGISDDCPVCRVMSSLHHSLAVGYLNPAPGFPVHAETVQACTKIFIAWIFQTKHTRAPPRHLTDKYKPVS